jgi:hypothetical protein
MRRLRPSTSQAPTDLPSRPPRRKVTVTAGPHAEAEAVAGEAVEIGATAGLGVTIAAIRGTSLGNVTEGTPRPVEAEAEAVVTVAARLGTWRGTVLAETVAVAPVARVTRAVGTGTWRGTVSVEVAVVAVVAVVVAEVAAVRALHVGSLGTWLGIAETAAAFRGGSVEVVPEEEMGVSTAGSKAILLKIALRSTPLEYEQKRKKRKE